MLQNIFYTLKEQGERSVHMSTKMNFKDFENEVIRELDERFCLYGSSMSILGVTVQSYNGEEEEKIKVKFEEEGGVPFEFSVHPIYERYMKDENYDIHIDNIAKCIKMELETLNISNCFKVEKQDFEDKVFFRLINAEHNKDLLSQVPHRRIEGLDLALTYHLVIWINKTVIIKNGDYEYSEEELYSMAVKNTPVLFAEKWGSTGRNIKSYGHDNDGFINSVDRYLNEIEKIANNFSTGQSDGYSWILRNCAAMREECLSEATSSTDIAYILSNEYGVYGSTVIAYPGCLEKISEKMKAIYGKGGFYVIPKSIDELLILSETTTLSEKEICKIIAEINEITFSENEVLSYNLYRYRENERRLELVR